MITVEGYLIDKILAERNVTKKRSRTTGRENKAKWHTWCSVHTTPCTFVARLTFGSDKTILNAWKT